MNYDMYYINLMYSTQEYSLGKAAWGVTIVFSGQSSLFSFGKLHNSRHIHKVIIL